MEYSFKFRPLERSDFDLLTEWHAQEHIIEWWGPRPQEKVVARYKEKLSQSWLELYIVEHETIPIGFIQTYHAPEVGNGWWPDEEVGTWGIDQSIGVPGLVGKGLGSAFVRAFSNQLLQSGQAKKVITDPSPSNGRAIRAYEKAGFVKIGLIETPEGEEVYMEKQNPT